MLLYSFFDSSLSTCQKKNWNWKITQGCRLSPNDFGQIAWAQKYFDKILLKILWLLTLRLYCDTMCVPSLLWNVCGKLCSSLSLYALSNLSNGCRTMRKLKLSFKYLASSSAVGLGYFCLANDTGTAFEAFRNCGL